MWSISLIAQYCVLTSAIISNSGAVHPILLPSALTNSTKPLSTESFLTRPSSYVQSRNNLARILNATRTLEEYPHPFPTERASSGKLDRGRAKMTPALWTNRFFGPAPEPSPDAGPGLSVIPTTSRDPTETSRPVQTISPDDTCSSEPSPSLGLPYTQQAITVRIPSVSSNPTGAPAPSDPAVGAPNDAVTSPPNALTTDAPVACQHSSFGSKSPILTSSSNSTSNSSSTRTSTALVSDLASTLSIKAGSNSTSTEYPSSTTSYLVFVATTSSSRNTTTFRTSRSTQTVTTVTEVTSKTSASMTAASASTSHSSVNKTVSTQTSSAAKLSNGAIAGIAIGSTAAVTLMIFVSIYLYRRRRRRKSQPIRIVHPPLRPQRSKALFNCPEIEIYLAHDNSSVSEEDDASSRYPSPPPTPPSPVLRGRRRTRDPSPFVDNLRPATPLSRESGSHLHSELNMREAILSRNLPNIMTWDELVI